LKKATNPNHGWQTQKYIQKTINRTRDYVKCGLCIHFGECKKLQVKNTTYENDYCHYPPPGKFKEK